MAVHRFRSPLTTLLRCFLLLVLAVAPCSPLAAEGSPVRLVLRLPAGVEVEPLVSYGALASVGAGEPADGELRIFGAPRLESLLREAGAARAARLADGLAEAPPAWNRTLVVALPAGTSRNAARALAARITVERLAESARVDPVYEPLVVGEFVPGIPVPAPAAAPDGGAVAREGFFPDDPLFANESQWGLYNTGLGLFGGAAGVDIGAPEAWARFAGSTATVLGVVDTGIDPAHPELNSTLFDRTPRLVAALSATDPVGPPADSIGHGTMVTGVMAALTNNGPQLDGRGVAGVAGGTGGDSTGVRLVSVKATAGRTGDATSADLARAILFAHQRGARAINVSFGGDEPTGLVRDACQWVADRGSTVIFGAGNSGDSRPQYPGWYATLGVAVSVGALDPFGELPIWSTYGDQVDVVAPGQNIFSTWLTYANANGSTLRNFAYTSGTSFSAPMVTGMAGLAYGLQPDLTGNDFQQLVRRTARDWGPAGRDEFFGYGFADAAAVIEAVTPPRRVVHGTAAAASWVSAGRESLQVYDSGITRDGYSVDGDYYAERFEVRAHAYFPGGFLDRPQVWVRPSGPGGWSAGRVHEADIPWGDVVPGSVTRGGADLLTHVYYIDAPPPECPACPPIGWLPRAPEQVVAAWSAWTRLDGPPSLRVLRPAPGETWNAGSYYEVEWEASDPDTVSYVSVYWQPYGGPYELLGRSGEAAGSLTVAAPCRPASGEGFLRVLACDTRGVSECVQEDVPLAITGGDCLPQPPATLRLLPPFPNPARGFVEFAVRPAAESGTASAVRITVHDARGTLVRRLVALEDPLDGALHAAWDGRTDDGTAAPSGVYVVRAEEGPRSATRRFVWLR